MKAKRHVSYTIFSELAKYTRIKKLKHGVMFKGFETAKTIKKALEWARYMVRKTGLPVCIEKRIYTGKLKGKAIIYDFKGES